MSRFNVGGTSLWIFNNTEAFTKLGVQSFLVVGECPETEKEDYRLNSLKNKKLVGLGPKQSFYSTLRAFLELRKVIREYQPDIINTHTSKAGLIGRLAAVVGSHDAALVHTYHGHVFTGYFSRPVKALIWLAEFLLSKLTDFFFITGSKVRDDLKIRRIINDGNSIVVYPTIFDLADDYMKNSNNEKDDKTKSGRLRVGSLGRKVKIKRLDRVVELATLRPNIDFVIAGDGVPLQELVGDGFVIASLQNIKEIGYIRPEDFWIDIDVCLITSDNEGIPSSPLEAALFKIPIIATDVGSVDETLVNSKTGILCTPTIDSLLIALDSLDRDRIKATEMGELGRKFVLEKFNQMQSAQIQLDGYKSALRISKKL